MTGLSEVPGSLPASANPASSNPGSVAPKPGPRPNPAQPGTKPAAAQPGPRPNPAQLVPLLDAAAVAFQQQITAFTDADVQAPSGLPGWSRGHVLAHVAGVADGMTRQLEYAARGETIELYDGGAEGRNRAIEEGSVRSADRHRADLDVALDRVLSAFRGLRESDWQAPISYRNGVVHGGGLAMWRELVIHLTDLKAGVEADFWTPVFCEHLFGFLAARVPAGVRLNVQPFGMTSRVLASGPDTSASRTISVNGMATDIAAWLAGRTPNLGSLRAEADADSVELPTLLPWPSALPV